MPEKTKSLTRRSERGFTLIELLVASTMMVIITGASVSLLISTFKDQSRITSSADQVGQARVGLRKIVDDIRQGSLITVATESELTIKTYIHATSCSTSPSVTATAIQCTVTYKCPKEASKATYECTRTIEGSTVKLITGLSGNAVFTYTPASPATSATYISAKLVLPTANSSATTTLESGAALRNSPTNLSY
jgi:prepilin-type N-terminal cleavage/methylation domain-containing protein